MADCVRSRAILAGFLPTCAFGVTSALIGRWRCVEQNHRSAVNRATSDIPSYSLPPSTASAHLAPNRAHLIRHRPNRPNSSNRGPASAKSGPNSANSGPISACGPPGGGGAMMTLERSAGSTGYEWGASSAVGALASVLAKSARSAQAVVGLKRVALHRPVLRSLMRPSVAS